MTSTVVLEQSDVSVTLDRLPIDVELAVDLRIDVGQHVDGAVRAGHRLADAVDRALQGLCEHLAARRAGVGPASGPRGAVFGQGVFVDGVIGLGILVRIRIAGLRGDIDGRRRRRGAERHLLGDVAVDFQGEVVAGGRKGHGLAADLDRLGLARRALHGEAGVQSGRLHLAVHIADDVGHGPGRRAHLGQVHGDVGGGAEALDGDIERHVALEPRRLLVGLAGKQLVGRIGGVVPRNADRGLVAGHHRSGGQAQLIQRQPLDVAGQLAEAARQGRLQTLDLAVGLPLLPRLGNQGGHGAERLVGREQLFVVGTDALEAGRVGAFIDELSTVQGRTNLFAGGRRAAQPGRVRHDGLLAAGRRRARPSRRARSRHARAGLIVVEQDAGIEADHDLFQSRRKAPLDSLARPSLTTP